MTTILPSKCCCPGSFIWWNYANKVMSQLLKGGTTYINSSHCPDDVTLLIFTTLLSTDHRDEADEPSTSLLRGRNQGQNVPEQIQGMWKKRKKKNKAIGRKNKTKQAKSIIRNYN